MVARDSQLNALYASDYKLQNEPLSEYLGHSEPPGGGKNGDFSEF